MHPEIVIGSPGCGKTTALLDILDQELAAGTEPEKIGFVSFTRKAADEAAERACARFNLPRSRFPWARTLHSLAFRRLGMRRDDVLEGRRLQEFGHYAGIRITGKWTDDGTMSGFETGDRIIFMENLARVRNLDLRAEYNRDDDGLPWREVERVTQALRQFKRERGLMDYTDMLSEFIAADRGVGLDVLFVDEGQDVSSLGWDVVRVLARGCRRVVVAGDDDQCHPPGTLILTARGHVPIETLQTGDKISEWERHYQRVMKEDYPIEAACRQYQGNLVNVNGVDCTPDHRVLMRWTQKTGCITYIMRRGDDYRVGWCQLFNVDGVLHPEPRRRMEKADALWVVKWHIERGEASFYEQELSIKYALPTVMFQPAAGNSHYTKEALDSFFDRVRGQARWRECLLDHGRDPNSPFLSDAGLHRRRSTLFVTQAANLIEGLCSIPIIKHGQTEWTPVRLSHRQYTGPVYSLNAPPHHYYVANNVVVHNCIFSWGGADVEQFIDLPGDVRVLEQSYRVPKKVQSIASGIITQVHNRRPKTWKARDSDGIVSRAVSAEEISWDDPDTGGNSPPILVLARNAFVLRDQVIPELRRQGVLYERGGYPSVAPGLLDAISNWERLRQGASLPVGDCRGVYRHMSSGSRISRGFKELPGFDDSEDLTLDNLKKRGGLLTDSIWHEAMDRLPRDDVGYVVRMRQRGEKLKARPRVRLSTIHSAKGGEADHVVLFKEVARRTAKEADLNSDAERRVQYVAVTRAKEKLTIVEAQGPLSCKWL